MATLTNINSSYAGEKAAGYISAALLGGKTLADGAITVKPNVKYREVVQVMNVSDDLVQDASCDFTATSTVNITERYLEPKHLQVNLEFCKKTFEQDWQAASMGFSAHQDLPKEFSDYLIAEVAGKVATNIENQIWAGTSGSASFDGITTILSGSADTIKLTQTGSAITAANVVDILGEALDATPERVYQQDDFIMYVSSDIFRAYRRSLGGFAANGRGANGFEGRGNNQNINIEYFDGVKLYMAKGLPSKTIITGQSSNFHFGTGLMSDHNEVKLIDLAAIDGSQNVRLVMRFTGGVQVGIPGDVVYYGA